MPYQALIYKVLISTPNDILTEIRVVNEVVMTWNAINSTKEKKYLDLISWNTHSYPQTGSSPQKLLNRQIVDDADILIAIFWTRLGTQTADYESGTVEEIERAIKNGKSVMIYFSKQPVSLDSVDLDQYKKVKEYCNDLKNRALYGEFASSEELRSVLNRHIAQVVGFENSINKNIDDDKNKELKRFYELINQLSRKAIVEWTSEENSQPLKTDDAKWIMKSIVESLIEYRSMISKDEEGTLSSLFDETIILGKQLGNHQMYMDGGKSYSEFWKIGNDIIQRIHNIADIIKNEIDECESVT